MARVIVFVALVIGLAAGATAAQDAGDHPLQAGDRIRIKTPSSSGIKGTLVGADQAALTVALEGRDAGQQKFARSEIAKLEVSRGRKRNVLQGALMGAAVGLFVDLAGTSGEGQNPCDFGACVILPLMGAAAGALVGVAVKTERWERVPIEAVRVVLAPVRNGVQVSLSFRF